MRENIGLFKAKRKDTKEDVEGYYVKCRGRHYILEIYNNSGYDDRWELSEWVEIIAETLCEFTGEDCNAIIKKHKKYIDFDDIVEETECVNER